MSKRISINIIKMVRLPCPHMSSMASQITSNSAVCLTVYSGWQQKHHQSPYCWSFVWWFPSQSAINSLRPSDTIWRHKSGSTLAQVMACCLMAPNHYLNQCWLIISKVQWHSSECNFIRETSATSHWNQLENYLSKILFKSPRGQWVNMENVSLSLSHHRCKKFPSEHSRL